MNDVTRHYDALIDENNDPTRDPVPMKEYMDKWDGDDFIRQLELNAAKNVLEIGVGTGRLALRVAPACAAFYGIDLSPKTIKRAGENLAAYENVNLICADFMLYEFDRSFDVIYASLTWMHMRDKETAISKVASLLKEQGRFLLSIDKSQEKYIDMGNRKLEVYPDTVARISYCLRSAGLTLIRQYDTEFAHIFAAVLSI